MAPLIFSKQIKENFTINYEDSLTFISGNGDLSVPSQQPRRHSTGYINIAELQPNLENMKIKPDVSIKLLAK